MIDEEIKVRMLAFLARPRTVRALCDEFKVTRPTIVFWLGTLKTEHGVQLKESKVREGLAGPHSKAYEVQIT